MEYESTISFQGNAETALKFARAALAQAGFQVTPVEDGSFQARYSGWPDTRRNPLLGASTVVVAATDDSLNLGASLGGVRKLHKFLLIFIGGMALLFLLGFGAFLLPRVRAGELPPFVLLIPVAPFLPWLVLIPVIVRMYASRVRAALHTLLENARTVGSEG